MSNIVFLRPGDSACIETDYDDTVTVWTSADPSDDVVFVGTYDSDGDLTATAALDLDNASRLGAEIVIAAQTKREQLKQA